MKTVHCIEYEQQEFTCYKTCWDRVCEDRTINCVKYVPETRSREICYTVCKPCFEDEDLHATRSASRAGKPSTREICYTVCKPCWETRTRCYTVYHPCWEDHSKEVCYTVCKPCWETKTRTYTVCKPCWETKSREICYTVCKPCWEEKTGCYTVCKPVLGRSDPRDQLQRDGSCELHEDDPGSDRTLGNRNLRGSGPNAHPSCVREPGTWTYDPCSCCSYYCPGECHTECVQCPPIKCCKKHWVSECCSKEVCCTKWVCEPRTKTCCYKVCHMVPEQKTFCYKVCHMVPEQRSPHGVLQGLPHGSGRADLLLPGLPHGARAT